MSTVVDNKGLEAPSPFKTFLKNNMQLMLVTVALFVILLFFSIAANASRSPTSTWTSFSSRLTRA